MRAPGFYTLKLDFPGYLPLYILYKNCANFIIKCKIIICFYEFCSKNVLKYLFFYDRIKKNQEEGIMPRKSNCVMLKERLTSISDCPSDIFDRLQPSEDLLALIRTAESGDDTALQQIIDTLYQCYINKKPANMSLLHFIGLGVKRRIRGSAERLYEYLDCFNLGFELAEEALDQIDVNNLDDDTSLHIKRALCKHMVHFGGERPAYASKIQLSKYAEDLVKLYLAVRSQKHAENISECKQLAEDCGIGSILTLPCLGAPMPKDGKYINDAKELESICRCMDLSNEDRWINILMRCAYEYCDIYMGSRYELICDAVITAMKKRQFYKDRDAGILAWARYRLSADEHTGCKESEDEYATLERSYRLCHGEIDTDDKELIRQMMSEAIYIDSDKEREKLEDMAEIGTEICHTKNRYLLMCTLKGHFKRANKHMWEMVLSIKNSEQGQIEIKPLQLSRTNICVTRGGISLDPEKQCCQCLAYGDIKIGEKVYPMESDMILDISHVSASKCETVDIKVRSQKQYKGYTVLSCQIYLC